MKKYRFIYLLCALSVLGFTSCDDLLTEKPDSSYKEEDFFTSEGNAQMAIYGIYNSFATPDHYGQDEMAMPASDDTYYINGTGTDNTRRDIAHYMVKNTNTWIQSLWVLKYQGIDRASYAIHGIENMAGYKENKKLIAMAAEARFLRAFLSFDLVKYWGDVPYKTTYTSGREDAFQGRVSREVIYDEIINDLTFAKNNLEWADGSSSPERATQGAARALLMRVYLQRAGYSLQMDGKVTRPDDAKRKEYFEAVIEEWKAFQANPYHDFHKDDYESLFKGFSKGVLNNTESLWEIAFFSPDGSKGGSGVWGTYNGPAVAAPGIKPTETGAFMGRANAFFRVVPEWKNFFEDQDERRDVMVCTYQYKWDAKAYNHKKTENKNGKDWYPGKWRREWMPIGYKDPNNTDVNYCVLRYADVVLMAAEAYNETNNTPEAWRLLNTVRARANATPITSANYASLLKAPKVLDLPFISDADEAGKFRTALYWERAFELAFEGQRKYDLLRWGILKEALMLMGNTTSVNKVANQPYPAYKNFVTGKHELFPIPLSELQSNPLLEGKNNPQYN